MKSHPRLKRTAWLSCLAALCGLLLMASVEAAKPAPPPPPPPPNPAAIYQWRPELGGWLDTQRNLVWGYQLTAVVNGGFSYDGAIATAPNYAIRLATAADDYDVRGTNMLAQADNYQALGDAAYAAGDYELADEYYFQADRRYVRAQEYFDSADIALAAAVNAAQFNNWRIPMKDEAVDASWKGLFSRGATGFNSFDSSPYVGFQQENNVPNWTSTLSGKNVWAYYPVSGSTAAISKSSLIGAIVVRTHVP